MNTPVPRTIRMQAGDNVAIVVNDGGLPAGTVFPDGLTLDHFRRFAETVGADQEKVTAAVSATVEAMVSSWPSVRRECPVPSFVAAHIEARLRTLPLLKSR